MLKGAGDAGTSDSAPGGARAPKCELTLNNPENSHPRTSRSALFERTAVRGWSCFASDAQRASCRFDFIPSLMSLFRCPRANGGTFRCATLAGDASWP